MTLHTLKEIGGGLICIAVLASMAIENPWALALVALCAILT